jgi:hypothetical protein
VNRLLKQRRLILPIRDITWTQDANIRRLETNLGYDNGVPGGDYWGNQVAWVEGYSQRHRDYGTFDDWRLPGGQVFSDSTCDDTYVPGTGTGCLVGEMGYLYQVHGIRTTVESMGLFVNAAHIGGYGYWTGEW